MLAPVVRQRKGEHFARSWRRCARRATRGSISTDEMLDLHEPRDLARQARPHTIEVYVDRLVLKPGIALPAGDSLELALKLAEGIVKLAPLEGEVTALLRAAGLHRLRRQLPGARARAPSPSTTPQGACPRCVGPGRAAASSTRQRSSPLRSKSLREGAIEPWEQPQRGYYQQLLETLATTSSFDLYTPYAELSPASRRC